jgi:hypothetical protein
MMIENGHKVQRLRGKYQIMSSWQQQALLMYLIQRPRMRQRIEGIAQVKSRSARRSPVLMWTGSRLIRVGRWMVALAGESTGYIQGTNHWPTTEISTGRVEG